MADILRATQPVNPGFESNTLRDNPIRPGDRGVENVVDPSKIIRPDNRSEREDKASNLLSQSNYDSFIRQMKESSSFVEEFSGLYFDKAQAYAAFGGNPALMELYTELTGIADLDENGILEFMKAQARGGSVYSEDFFRLLKNAFDSTSQMMFKSQILQAAGRYGDMVAGGHKLQMIIGEGNAMSEHLFPADAQILQGILSRLILPQTDQMMGQDPLVYMKENYQNNRKVLLRELIPFFSNYIHRTHDMGAVRSLMSLVTHQTAAYVNGNPDKVLEDFTGLVFSLGMADIPVGEQGAAMLVSGLLKKRMDRPEEKFNDKLCAMLKAGLGAAASKDVFLQMLKTILGNESVYMPLLHFMLPVNMGSQSLFSEIWVEQNDGRKEKDRENERTIRMLIKMEVKRLGLFDIVLDYRESGEVGIQLYYPRKLSGEEREMENALNTMITKNSMSPRAVTLKAMKEPLRPIDVFGRLTREKEIVDVRI